MFIPWELKPGPRYAESLAKAEALTGPELGRHLKALWDQIRYAGYASTEFLDANHRVAELADVPNGYTIAMYVTLDPSTWVATAEWVEVGPLDVDLPPWDD